MLSAPESEAMVLGGVLSGTTDVDDVLGQVKPEEFAPGAYKTIFETIKVLHEKGTPIDLVTINNNAVQRFDVTVLAQLTESAASKQSALHHARVVKDAFVRRTVAEQGEELIRAARSGVETSALIEQATTALSGIATAETGEQGKDVYSVVQQVWNETTERMDKPTATTGIATGYQQLDRLLGGYMEERFIIVAGRPGMGKTTYLLNSTYRGRTPAQVFSIEMSAGQLVQRLICQDQHLNTLAVRDAHLNKDQEQQFSNGCVAVGDSRIRIDDSPVITVEEIKARSRIAVKKYGCKLIAVDHIGLVKPTNARVSREQQISHISWQLKSLARELKVPVIALSQLNRAVELRPDKRPILADLRDSGSLEQDTDIVIMLYNGSYYANNKTYKAGVETTTEVLIRKHRDGPLGVVPLIFRPEFSALEEIGYDRKA
ncbi:replicative DNA helicase [Maridesulfovibrio sp.]|uniref:replicative DNA helicase n=1 Tax=Maridesulfovibrio sp. TaxID=2795000 RepID=UPI002AA8B6FB|nr:replicative DNA helicase [Maridesulfovibrio sp.]